MKMVSLAFMISASATLAAMPQNPPPSMQKPTPAPVAVQGCVDRAMPDGPAMYILIDAQAGGSSPVMPAGRSETPPPPTAKAPATIEPRYWLTGATSTIDFSKHQNQRVEVVGMDGRAGDETGRQAAPTRRAEGDAAGHVDQDAVDGVQGAEVDHKSLQHEGREENPYPFSGRISQGFPKK